MDDFCKRQLRLLAMRLEELADRQTATRDAVRLGAGGGEEAKTGAGYYSGAADTYRDAARRVQGLIVTGKVHAE